MRFGMMVARGGLYRHIDDMQAGDRLTVFKAGKDDFYTVTVEASESAREDRQAHPSQGGEVEKGLQQKKAHIPRPMTGFWHTLTDEQKKAALEYDGPENHGPRDKGPFR